MKNKTLKIVISLIIIMIGTLLMANNIYAADGSGFSVYNGEYQITGGRFAPQTINGHGLLYCIQGHAAFTAHMNRSDATENKTSGYWCSNCESEDAQPFSETRTSMEYKPAGKINMQNYQDAAYVLAFGNPTLENAYAIWSTTINSGAKEAPNALGQEAAAYLSFYHSIHSLNYASNDGTSEGDSSYKPSYSLPTVTDVHRVSMEKYNDDITKMQEQQFINEVSQTIKEEWKSNYDIALTKEQVERVESLAQKYYSKKTEEAKGYPLPSFNDIAVQSEKFYDKIIEDSVYVSKDDYVKDMLLVLQQKWEEKYDAIFTPEDEAAIRLKLEDFYNKNLAKKEEPVDYPFPPTPGDIIEASKGTQAKVDHAGKGFVPFDDYVTDAQCYLSTILWIHYGVNYTAEEIEGIKEGLLRPYYDEHFAKEEEEGELVAYSTNQDALNSSNYQVEFAAYNRYDAEHIKKLAYATTYESEDYPQPTMSDVRKVAKREFYDEEEKQYTKKYERTDFIERIMLYVSEDWWDKYEVDLDHFELHDVGELAAEFYDKYVNPGHKPDPSEDEYNYDYKYDDNDNSGNDSDIYDEDFINQYEFMDQEEVENAKDENDEFYNNSYHRYDKSYYDITGEYPEPTMLDVHRIAIKEYYNDEEHTFYQDLTREDFAYMISVYIEDEWWEKYKAIFEKVDRDRVVKLAKEYFDTYIKGGKTFNEADYKVIEDPTMDDIHTVVQEKKYTQAEGKDSFTNKVTNDIINKWKEQFKGELSSVQIENVKNLAREYYDKYLSKDQNYSEGHKDQFAKLVKDTTNTDKLKVMPTRSTSTYVVGPFSVEYPNGNFNGVNKFSWITNVRVKDQNNIEIGNVANGTLQIIDKNGNLIYDTDRNGNTYNVPKNNTEFYVKFRSNTALRVSVTIDFKYLESIEAEVYRYTGTLYEWEWIETGTGRSHKETYTNRHGKTKTRNCGEYHQWKLGKKVSSFPQVLMEVKQIPTENGGYYANPIYAESSFTMEATITPPPPPPTPTPTYTPTPTPTNTPTPTPTPNDLDLTMAIEGVVFLDQDAGKTNTGNDEYDIGEQLEGIDVWLYKKDGTFVGITLTDSNGRYRFEGLNAMEEYYVQFTYNGMLYTNVVYKQDGENASKATEGAQNHNNNRTDFNNVFKEIGSDPANYSTKDCITGAVITNKAYKQDEIVTLFKEVAKAMKDNNGDKVKAYNAVIAAHATDTEIKQKVQFIADIRMNAYTVTNYSRFDSFKIDETTEKIGNTTYTHIYYEQYHVNLGIKARPTFDLALYKDVLKAEVQINGKSETYTYDKRTSNGNGFSIGVSETDYLNGVRGAYIRSLNYDNQAKRRTLETDTYDLNLRSEEVANGQSKDYNKNTLGVDTNNKYALNYDYDNLKQNGTNKDDRLKIYVTYKIAVRNQSGITGAVTEIVDYYDPNYKFVEAFIGDDKGNPTGKVEASERSKYANTDYKSSRGAYETIYLRPEEQRLSNNNKEQYIYVVLQVLGPKNDAGTLLSDAKLLNKNELSLTNLAEINGYKTYDSATGEATPGLIDIDSTPGNLDLRDISALTAEEIKKHEDKYEDDTSKAPALIYKLLDSRTIEGTVFEDETTLTNNVRKGNGKLDNGEKGINGVIVQLVEIKNGEMFVRSTTKTVDGWYGFTGFLPGNYTIRYIYGADEDTAMTTNSKWIKGKNETSYNGQDYQSTIFGVRQGVSESTYKTDADLIARYKANYDNKNAEESAVNPNGNTIIKKYQGNSYYWYTIEVENQLSDAKDDEYRRQQVIDYARHEYVPKETTYNDTAVANHKAEVFNSYLKEQPSHITEELNRQLANELERRTYRFAYTAEMPIEVEYATQTIAGTGRGYEHKIRNVDFGIAQRPKAKTELTKNVEHIKVTTTDGTVLFDTNGQVNNLSWPVKTNRYQAKPPIQIIMDEELISGATVELTYKITVTNKGEKGESVSDAENGEVTTTMRRILDYVDNSLNFNQEDNLDANGKALWKVVTVDDMQNTTNATFINNSPGANGLKLIDLSTQQTLLQTTPENPLSKALKVGESAEATLTLRKVLAAESDTDQLTYNNIMETIEIDNEVGRYDHDSVPGNQDPEKEPTEDDTYKSEIVTILPPFGAKSYYKIAGLGIAVLAILGVGVFVIKKYVVDKKA